MVRKLITLLSLWIGLVTKAQNSLPAIGYWQEHLPYNSTIDITASSQKIYCATPYSLFSIDKAANEIERLSRVIGLSETGISAIRYDTASEKLLIAYTNSNIDIIYRNDIYNIPDIKRENISGDKSIYNIYPLNNNFYLSTGLGVIVIDGNRYEIKDSWFIGSGGGHVKVSGFTADATTFYAATDEGLKKANINLSNLANYTNWQLVSGSNGLPAGSCRDVVNAGGKIFALKSDSVWVQNGTAWNFFYTNTGYTITSINSTGGKLAICFRSASAVNKVVFLNTDGTLYKTIQQNGVTPFPRKAIIDDGNYWIADQFNAVSKFSTAATADEVYSPNSPQDIASGEMIETNGTMYITAGSVDDNWNYQYNGNGIYRYKNGEWKNYNRFNFSRLDTMLDFITIAADRADQSLWAGSFGGGLLHIKEDESFEIYKQNSTLLAPAGDPGSYRVAGLAVDQSNNLWISNFGSPTPLALRKADGTFRSFATPYILFENAVSQIVLDEAEQLWIVSPLGNGLLCYNHGENLDNTSDDRWRLYRSGTGNGNLPSNDVLCIAKDKSGFIWVGTADGIGVIQCAESAFTNGCEAILPIVQQDNFAGYLFKGENVQSIAVDGADRKWIATRNGVWLISPDGDKTIYRFTEDNSPLLSNDVKKIAIDGKTGEVYFATAKGICSFRSTATEGTVKNNNVLVFPNPVPPGYGGTIGIRGLAENAVVKITELDGRLVYQTRALGGQAVWNGYDYKGRKISSGVYLVFVSNDDKTEKAAAKIVFISK